MFVVCKKVYIWVNLNPTMFAVVVGIDGIIFPEINPTLSLEQRSILKLVDL